MGRLLFIVAAPLLLASCLLTPGRFTSTLDIRADRGFTFTYQGEAMLADPAGTAAEGFGAAMAEAFKSGEKPEATPRQDAESAQTLQERRALAEALSREVGYRSVEYLGKDRFRIDYAFTGRLDRSFVFPFNPDGAAILPWIAIEVRKDGTARMEAAAFGAESSETMPGAPPGQDPMKERQGSFTFTTDATLLMHNNEDGPAPGPGTRVVWKITPTTRTAPTAVVRFAN